MLGNNEMERIISQSLDAISTILPAILGGLIDYINQLQRGRKVWSILGFLIHFSSAIFFGWMSGTLAEGLGYTPDVVAASGGMGGYLGVRLADLLSHVITSVKGSGSGPNKGN